MRGDMCDPILQYLLFLSNSNQNGNVLIYFSETLHISTPNDRFFFFWLQDQYRKT